MSVTQIGRSAEIIREGDGTRLDPIVIEALERLDDQFNLIRRAMHPSIQTGNMYRASAA